MLSIVLLLIVVLVGVFSYLFISSKSVSKKQNTQDLFIIQETNIQENAFDTQANDENPKKTLSSNEFNQAQPVLQSLRSEYEQLLQNSKQNTSLGEPRYDVFVLHSKKLSTQEKTAINEITSTLSKRGGFLEYTLFVDKNENAKMTIYIFNKSLLDEQSFFAPLKNLPPLWFKFNQSSIQSIKNSFYIKEFKNSLAPQAKLKSIVLNGYTDELGSKEYNYLLGLKRSAAVASEFLRISAKITLQSYGKEKQLTQEKSEAKRYINRRVETLFD